MPTDWSKIVKELLADEEEENSKNKSVEEFFKSVYTNATDEQRRAMVKSFSTSGGTVLSTNWEEVAKTDYSLDAETVPKSEK